MPDLLRRATRDSDDPAGGARRASDELSLSVVGTGTTVDGDLRARGELRIEGKVLGTIRSKGPVVVAPEGTVEGRIEAELVVAAGRIDGEIAASQMVRVESTARVTADVDSPTLAIEDGATFDGAVNMDRSSAGAGAASAA